MQPQSRDPYHDEPPPSFEYVGVAPAWRFVGLASLVVIALLLFLVIVLAITLAQQGTAPYPAPPMAVAAPAVPVPAMPDAPDEDNVPGAALPYPTAQDLSPPGTFPVPGEEADARPSPSPRAEFLRNAQVLWSSADGLPVGGALVSPDGALMALHDGGRLIAGPVGAARPVDENNPWANAGVMGPAGVLPVPSPASRSRDVRPALGGWSAEGNRLYWTDGAGRVVVYDGKSGRLNRTTLRAEAVVPVPGKGQLVLVKARPRAKVEGAPAPRDATEVVLVNEGDGTVARTLVRDDKAVWRAPAVSPDGKQILLVSNRGHEGEKPTRWRVFLAELALDARKAPLKPLTQAAERIDAARWTPDGKTVIVARAPSPLPADHRQPAGGQTACDLFALDLGSGQEMRLTRGGGFTAPTVSDDGDLGFLVETPQQGGTFAQLVRMSMKGVREFLRDEEAATAKAAERWKAVLNDVAVVTDPTPEAMRALDETFRKAYAAHFKQDAPTTAAGLDALRREVSALDLPPAARPRWELVLGAVEGEYLRRRNDGGAWHLTRGPLRPPRLVTGDNPFGFAYNPFRPLAREPLSVSLAEVVVRAAGRAPVLGNDPAAATAALATMGDANLDRLEKLLQGNFNGDDVDRQAHELGQRYQRNYEVILRLGRLLHRHGRVDALRKLSARYAAAPPADARLYNLLGVALLSAEPPASIKSFQDALRCDLRYGPAYLNLAQAYQETGQHAYARSCLRHYLRKWPDGDHADDARRRLATLGDETGGAPAPGP